jgi:hypothetical protein
MPQERAGHDESSDSPFGSTTEASPKRQDNSAKGNSANDKFGIKRA